MYIKLFFSTILLLLFNVSAFAESSYFKKCALSNAVTGDYVINTDRKVIEVTLEATDGTVQNFTDKIKSIEKDRIISEKIKSQKGDDIYFQYFLNAEDKSVTKLQFKKQSGIDIDLFKLSSKRESFCSDVKVDWDKIKIEEAVPSWMTNICNSFLFNKK